ncbi:hypothetical protein C1I97_04130 [Streptomyces sp. NTH33]|uniref:hypothetical protein n=1 Tax=Streptomyces sp. NTH33 TaxID=1735453 RepID=UPI000DA98D55|nr:hypothetical protein [Streptomyces sp. NTH33]PZH18086.1 hypothetical protein C1I97_04130 [Streptomyces sp. NTH33]
MQGCVFAGQPRQSAAQRFVRQVTLSEAREIVQARVEETAGGPYPIALLTGQPYHERPWCFVFSGET